MPPLQIELDLPRTFPRHAWLSGPEGQEALRAVLTAYAGHNPDVGYCQVGRVVATHRSLPAAPAAARAAGAAPAAAVRQWQQQQQKL